MLHIIVCMKQVLDPEMPLSLFTVDTEAKRAVRPKATPPVLSPFDEKALEVALRIKDNRETQVTVISLGEKPAKAVVTAALAAGADDLVLLQDEMFDEFDTHLTARAIAAAVQKLGRYDLILCGLQAADTNAGQVGPGIAHVLGIPCVTAAGNVEMNGDSVRIKRTTPDGWEVIEAPVPAVVTVAGEAGLLRKPDMQAFISAAKKPLTILDAGELGLESDLTSRVTMMEMRVPVCEGACEILDGAGPEEKARNLAARLREIEAI